MNKHLFELATEADDAQLREILSATPMPGRVSVTLRRDPSYFDAAAVDGTVRQVVACRESESNRIVGFGSRSIRKMYVNGTPTPVGYLSMLRARKQHRNLGLLTRGYRYLRDLHHDGQTRIYLTTIADGNDRAIRLLTSRRAGLPAYHRAGQYHTVVIPIARRTIEVRQVPGFNVRPAQAGDTSAILKFLKTQGPARQFFPCYESGDFFSSRGTFRDMTASDVFLAFQDGDLTGMLGSWDQRAFRQTTVNAYSGPLRWVRPVYNAWAGLRGRPSLPKPGEQFRFHTAAFPVVKGSNPQVAAALLDQLLASLSTKDCDYLLVGLHETDPLLPIVASVGTTTYRTHLFYVCWDDGEELREQLDNRPPYLELGCL